MRNRKEDIAIAVLVVLCVIQIVATLMLMADTLRAGFG
jgi:hypothetical protein